MIGSKKKSLKEAIVELLISQKMTSKKILTTLMEEKYNITIQAVYKQLNALREEEVILKNKKEYFVSNEWKRNIIDMLSDQKFTLPDEGERFTYKFSSLVNLDAHWKHITDAIVRQDKEGSVLSYCPHQIWPYVPTRMESEKNIVQMYEKSNRYNYFILGGKTSLDKKYKKVFNQKYFKVEFMANFSKRRNTHITIVGDIIVWSIIKKEIAAQIDRIYASNNGIKEQVKELVSLLGKDQGCKIIIERNTKKALMYKKRFQQIFARIY